MRFSAIGLCAVLVGVCLLSNPAVTNADEIADLKAIVEAQQKQITDLKKIVEDQQTQIKEQLTTTGKQQEQVASLQSKVKSLEEGFVANQTQIGDLKKSLELKINDAAATVNAELKRMQGQLFGLVSYEALPPSWLLFVDPDKLPKEFRERLAILRVVNSSGGQRELFVNGTSYQLAADRR